MNTIIKLVLTLAFVTAIAWPLLFWGKPALTEHGSVAVRPSFHHHMLHQQEAVW